MSNNRFTWSGLDDLRAALRALPAELHGEAAHIVEAAGNAAAFEVKAAYGRHRRTGNLQDHVKVERLPTGPFGVAVVVKSTARHAHLFERGTQARHTAIGANRGTMPPGNVFIPAVIKHRRRMYDELAALLRRVGLLVLGEAA